jgi:type II secretory ATPase GspE/PulE/Tfp pilus assembly ATPase PilB-like protein
MFNDKMTDWYEVINKKGNGIKYKLDKNFNKHYIKPCSMMIILGSTGAGKSTALVEFLSRKNNAFYEIIIFSGSTADEPLLNMLKDKMEGIQIIDNVDELPELTDFNEADKKNRKTYCV